jgi:hypothetical protein
LYLWPDNGASRGCHSVQSRSVKGSAQKTIAQPLTKPATLATYGFPAATFAAALATLGAFSDADKAHQSALSAAPPATANRDAVKSLNAWVKQFNKIAGVALKNYPGLGKKRSVTTSRRPVKDN